MKNEFVHISEGKFQLDGKRWVPYGVNYLPLYAINLPVSGGIHWYDPLIYDEKAIKDDLSMIADMGCTAVSIQIFCNGYHFTPWYPMNLRRFQNYKTALSDPQLKCIDSFFKLCDRHNLKVDIHCIGSDPLYFNEEVVKSFIVDAGFWQNPVIYSWALSWEPHFGLHYERKLLWDEEWNKWVLNKYGSNEQAFKKWAYKAEITEGKIVSPQDYMVRKAGPWEKMFLDYESFLWGLARDHYAKVSKIIRQMAPHQLIFARTVGVVGIPEKSPNEDILFYIPTEKVSEYLDYVGFEWWVEPSNIIYSKLAAKGKPVVCQEFGFDLSGSELPVLPRFNVKGLSRKQALEKQADAYEKWYEIMFNYGVDGAFLWFWPGGPRKDEAGSDFGVVEQDRTLRPVCKVVKEYSKPFRNTDSILQNQTIVSLDLPVTGYYNNSWPVKYKDLRKRISSLPVKV